MRSTIEACAYVDELGPSAMGEVVMSGDDGPRGAVFVEGGRVCWAAASGLSRRLTELLGARAGLSPPTMEAVFAACKREGTPLGEHLLSRGLVTADELRRALLEHTVESLARLATSGARASWHPRERRGYSPRFTFTTSEIVLLAGARAHAVSARVTPLLERLFDRDQWAIAFVRAEASARPEPVAAHGVPPPSATTLLRIGQWATSVLDVAGAFSDEAAMCSSTRNGGETPSSLVAFRLGRMVVVGDTGGLGPGRILNHRAERRRKGAPYDADL